MIVRICMSLLKALWQQKRIHLQFILLYSTPRHATAEVRVGTGTEEGERLKKLWLLSCSVTTHAHLLGFYTEPFLSTHFHPTTIPSDTPLTKKVQQSPPQACLLSIKSTLTLVGKPHPSQTQVWFFPSPIKLILLSSHGTEHSGPIGFPWTCWPSKRGTLTSFCSETSCNLCLK